MKTIRTTLVSAIFRPFGLLILQENTVYVHCR